MERNLRFYKFFSLIMAIVVASLLCAMGMIALHRSMTLKLGFNAEPSIYCYIEYKAPSEADSQYKPLFSNVTNTGAGLTPSVTANASLSGNTLTLTTEFEQLGASFDFRIYNYNNFGLKVTCAGLSKSTSANTSAANVATNASPIIFSNITTGGEKIVFSFEEYNAYTITFNANGGSGEMQAMEVEVGQPVILVTNSFTNSGYSFNGWNTKPDGTGTSYANLANFTPNSNITLYAMWKVAEFTITYENIVCVDATADNSANPTTYKDTTPTFTLEEPTKTGCEFLGWTWEGQTEPQKSVTITQGTTGNKTYKANWGATLMKGDYIEGSFIYTVCSKFETEVNIAYNNSVIRNNAHEISQYVVPGAGSSGGKATTLTSITFGYWGDYKNQVLVNEYVNSENTIAYGIPIDTDNTGSIRLFGNGTKAYILSPNKIFANSYSPYLFSCLNNTSSGYAHKLNQLTFDNFDTRNTTNFGGGFYDCSNLQTIFVNENWDLSNLTSSTNMFFNCTSLEGGNGTKFNSSYTDATYARIDGKDGLPGYFTAIA